MRRRFRSHLLLALLGERLVAEVPSGIFGTLWVTDSFLQAKRHLRSDFLTVQTVLDRRDPRRPRTFPLKAAVQALKTCPVAGDILILGLGGGAFVHAAKALRPGAKIVAVEADPAVAEAARLYFGLPPGVEVAVGGALEFLQGAVLNEKRFAFVFVDIFDRTHTPDWLKELTPLVGKTLLPGGVAVVNTTRMHPFDRKQGAVVAAFRASFPDVKVRRFPPVPPRNEVLVCRKNGNKREEVD